MSVKTDHIRVDHRHRADMIVDGATGDPVSFGGGGSGWIGPMALDIADLVSAAGTPAWDLTTELALHDGDILQEMMLLVDEDIIDGDDAFVALNPAWGAIGSDNGNFTPDGSLPQPTGEAATYRIGQDGHAWVRPFHGKVFYGSDLTTFLVDATIMNLSDDPVSVWIEAPGAVSGSGRAWVKVLRA